MRYLCPRDQTKLLWRDYLKSGRWHCRACSGTLAYESHLQEYQVFQQWFNSLKPAESRAQLKCPVCTNAMKPLEFLNQGRAIQIDRCEICRGYWFDPGEFKLAGDHSAREEGKITITHLGSAYDVYERKRELRLRMIFSLIGLALIAFDVWMYFMTKEFAHEYRARMTLRHRAADPAGSAMLALPFLVIFSIFPTKVPGIILPALFFLFEGVMVWVARF